MKVRLILPLGVAAVLSLASAPAQASPGPAAAALAGYEALAETAEWARKGPKFKAHKFKGYKFRGPRYRPRRGLRRGWYIGRGNPHRRYYYRRPAWRW